MTECKHTFDQDLDGRITCIKCHIHIEETQVSFE